MRTSESEHQHTVKQLKKELKEVKAENERLKDIISNDTACANCKNNQGPACCIHPCPFDLKPLHQSSSEDEFMNRL